MTPAVSATSAAWIPRAASLLAIAGGCVVLAGWVFGIRILEPSFPLPASMKVTSEAAVIAAGISLWLRQANSGRAATVLAWFVALVGAITLSQDILGLDLRIDQRPFTDTGTAGSFAAGRMAPTTAFCLLVLGTALAFSASRTKSRLVQFLALLVAALSSITIIGYAYGVKALYGPGPFSTMAIHSAVLLLALSVGVLFLNPTEGLPAVVLSPGPGGSMARRLLPAVVIIPLVLGWFKIALQRRGLFEAEFGVSLVVVETIILLSAVIWVNAQWLVRSDVQRRQAETELRELTAALDHRVAEQTRELSRNEEKFRGLLEAAPDSMVVVDREGRVVHVNAQTERLFGYDRSELLEAPVETLVPARFQAAHGGRFAQFFSVPRTGVIGAGLDLYGRRKDGSEFPVEISLSGFQTEDATLVSAAIRDITVRRQGEAAAKQAQEQIRSSLAEKELLLREIHHRVKNNLQVIASLLKLESESVTDARAVHGFQESLARVRSMALLHEKLYQSRNLGHVDLADYLRQLALTLMQSHKIDAGRVGLSFAFDEVSLPMDYAVPCGLIANELISNALKHAFPGGRGGEIRIELKGCADDQLRLSVADDGVGLPEGLDVRRSETMGLQLVNLLVDQVHGTLRTSAAGSAGGAFFEIVFANATPRESVAT